MNLFNTRTLSLDERFRRACILCLPLAVVLGILFNGLNDLVMNLFRMEFQILYLGLGYLVGMMVAYVGRGTQRRFMVLGLLCGVVALLASDLAYYYGLDLLEAFYYWCQDLFLSGFSSLLSWVFRGSCLAAAYNFSILR